MPRAVAPPTHPELEAWLAERLASPDLHATPHALEMAPLVAFRQPSPPPTGAPARSSRAACGAAATTSSSTP